MMKPKVEGVRLFGKWSYAATCPCGWKYHSSAGWDFVYTLALAHADMMDRTHRRWQE